MPRTPLLHPGEYFAERPPEDDLLRAAAVVLLVALATTAAAAVVGLTFAERLDFMVTVDNPAHTPEHMCDAFATSEMSTPSGCGEDVPETTQVNFGQKVWEEFRGFLPLVFVVTVVAWVGAAVLAHAATAFADGASGSFAGTLAVSGWAAGPNLLQVALGTGFVYLRLQSLTVPSDPAAAVAKLETLATFGSGLPMVAVLLVVTAWKAVVWSVGLRRARDISADASWTIAGVAAALAFLGGLAN
ncbi:Yip1 family protein [Halobium salinum]|uniref:Yip1 family protein n=1 Tax=Halobium salinum TaxID=1364940 RepID=A0ABD5PD36_9EURY|nr:Yip1 family protein [Halobium salinum]